MVYVYVAAHVVQTCFEIFVYLKVVPMNQKKSNKVGGVLSYLQSVLAAFVGVQSEAKRQEDFADDSLFRIIAIAFGSAVVFILVVWLMVSIALP